MYFSYGLPDNGFILSNNGSDKQIVNEIKTSYIINQQLLLYIIHEIKTSFDHNGPTEPLDRVFHQAFMWSTRLKLSVITVDQMKLY